MTKTGSKKQPEKRKQPTKGRPKTRASSAGGAGATTKIDPRLLEILVCPLTKGPLEYDAPAQELISRQARLAYPIKDGIPIMLPEEARALDDD